MDELVGPLSEGKVLLQLSMVTGVAVAATAWVLLSRLEVPLPSSLKPYVVVGAFVFGLGSVFALHVAWYYRDSRSDSR